MTTVTHARLPPYLPRCRIIPRHHFLLLKGVWQSPLPLSLLTKTDARFLKSVPDTSAEEYERFKLALESSGAAAALLEEIQPGLLRDAKDSEQQRAASQRGLRRASR